MSDFAILKKDELGTERVVNKIVSEYPFAQQLVLNGEADRAVQLFTDDQKRDVAIGSTYDPATGVFTPPYDAMTLEQAKAQRKREIAAARYAAEIAGVAVGGVTIRTDRESQALITGAALKATQDAAYTCTWKAESGFVTLDAATVLAVADAVRTHIQTCFDAEAAKCALIDAAQTVEDVEAVVW